MIRLITNRRYPDVVNQGFEEIDCIRRRVVLVRRGFHVFYRPEENLAKTSMTRQTLLQVTGYSLAASLEINTTLWASF
jgi:hypothetical protein